MKRRDELKELRDASRDEVAKKLDEKEHELMNLRFRHASGQLQHSAQLLNVRRSIARMQTVLKEMERR